MHEKRGGLPRMAGLRGPPCGAHAAPPDHAPAPAHPPRRMQSADGSMTVLVEWGREGDEFDLAQQVNGGQLIHGGREGCGRRWRRLRAAVLSGRGGGPAGPRLQTHLPPPPPNLTPCPAAQVLHRTVGLSCYRGDDLASSEVEVVAQRQYTLQEVDLLTRATGFEVGARGRAGGEGRPGGWDACAGVVASARAGTAVSSRVPQRAAYPCQPTMQVVEMRGDFEEAVGLDHEEAFRAVVCLRRLAQ